MDRQAKDEERSNFLELLALISNKVAQIEFQDQLPDSNIFAEIISMWFDDTYYPEASWFEQAFAPDERAVLQEFNALFESKVKDLPNSADIHIWHSSKVWDEIVKGAKDALKKVGG